MDYGGAKIALSDPKFISAWPSATSSRVFYKMRVFQNECSMRCLHVKTKFFLICFYGSLSLSAPIKILYVGLSCKFV